MASADELRPSEPGERGGDVRGDRDLSGVPEAESGAESGGAAEIEVELSGSPLGYVLTKEPPSGFYIRVRYADHHTAAIVFHRDDAEGHDDGRWWWSHSAKQWVRWSDIELLAQAREEPMVLEPLFAPPGLPGCAPDGMHNEMRCENPDFETFK